MKEETHEKFENISQSSRENWLHPTVAVRHSDSYFDCDISAAWLHVIGAEPLKVKSWIMTTRLGASSFSRFQSKFSRTSKKGLRKLRNPVISLVGARGFEPPTL